MHLYKVLIRLLQAKKATTFLNVCLHFSLPYLKYAFHFTCSRFYSKNADENRFESFIHDLIKIVDTAIFVSVEHMREILKNEKSC